MVACHFADDGVYERIERSCLRVLDNRFLRLPFQAFEVKLDGVDLKGVGTLFRKFFDEKLEADEAVCLIARPISYEPLTVRLYDTSGRKDIDVNRLLLDYIATSKEHLVGSLKSIRPSELPELLSTNTVEP